MNQKSDNRIWGLNEDGTPYQVGITVRELREQLSRFQDSDEVCVAVCQKKNWNGGSSYIGKLKSLEEGSNGQIWLKARVLDESQE